MFKHIPNILSAFRILLVPVFAVVYFSNHIDAHQYALVIFIVAGITDIIDGHLARTYNLITKVGTVLDPLADKLMQLTALICLTVDRYIPIWMTVLILGLELGMICAGIFIYFKRHKTVIPSNRFGKSATVLFTFAILIVIIFPASQVSKLLVAAALILKMMALSTYIHKYYTDIKPGLDR